MELSSLNEVKFIVLIKETNNIDEIDNFFMNNYWNKIENFVKLMRKVLMRWKNWSDFKGQHSIQFQGEDWSKIETPSLQEKTECQERCAREAAWRLAKSILKLKEKNKAAFLSPSENWCLPAPSNLKPEEREFVVDSGASMYMISKRGLDFCWNGYFDEVV